MVVSHRGPQFTFQFWNAFCQELGATADLTLGYHHQANGHAKRVNEEFSTVCLQMLLLQVSDRKVIALLAPASVRCC